MFVSLIYVEGKIKINLVKQHKKKYSPAMLYCSLRAYQRIIKLKYTASQYYSKFCFNRPMCLYKS